MGLQLGWHRPGQWEQFISSAGVTFVAYAFFVGAAVAQCGVHQDIGGCSRDVEAFALSNAVVYSQ